MTPCLSPERVFSCGSHYSQPCTAQDVSENASFTSLFEPRKSSVESTGHKRCIIAYDGYANELIGKGEYAATFGLLNQCCRFLLCVGSVTNVVGIRTGTVSNLLSPLLILTAPVRKKLAGTSVSDELLVMNLLMGLNFYRQQKLYRYPLVYFGRIRTPSREQIFKLQLLL